MLLHNFVFDNNIIIVCARSWIKKWIPDLYDKTLKIMQKKNYDFLKINLQKCTVEVMKYNGHGIIYLTMLDIKYFPINT